MKALEWLRLPQLCIVLLGLTGSFLIWSMTELYGTGVSPDAVVYVSVARNLNQEHAYTPFDGRPMVLWPPVYPTVISVPAILGIDPLLAARCLNAVLFGVLVILSGLWLQAQVRRQILAVVASLAVLCSYPLATVSRFAWTEPLYLFLMLVLLRFIWRTRHILVWHRAFALGALTATACLTRYAGVALIPCILAAVWFTAASRNSRLRNSGIYLATSILPLAAWLTRNYLVSSTLAGDRSGAAGSPMLSLYRSVSTLSLWLMPDAVPRPIKLVVLGIVGLVLFGVAVFVIRSHLRLSGDLSGLASYALLPGLALAHILELILVASASVLEPINDRLLSPVFIPMVWFALISADRILDIGPSRAAKWLQAFLLVVTVSWLGYSGWRVFDSWRLTTAQGAGGFATRDWRESDLTVHLVNHPSDHKMLSNAPAALYYLTNLVSDVAPRRSRDSSRGADADEIARIQSLLQERPCLDLVWFNKHPSTDVFTIPELAEYFRVDTVILLSGGSIHQLSSKYNNQ